MTLEVHILLGEEAAFEIGIYCVNYFASNFSNAALFFGMYKTNLEGLKYYAVNR